MKSLKFEQVILRPVVTEKTLRAAEHNNTYTFEVRQGANKVQIRQAVESLFEVGVTDVRTHRYLGKQRRMGRSVGTTGNWKKAVIRLKEGDSIDFY